MTKEYMDWVEWTRKEEKNNIPPLTSTYARFAEWLLEEENAKIIGQIGNLSPIFESVRTYLKSPKTKDN